MEDQPSVVEAPGAGGLFLNPRIPPERAGLLWRSDRADEAWVFKRTAGCDNGAARAATSRLVITVPGTNDISADDGKRDRQITPFCCYKFATREFQES